MKLRFISFGILSLAAASASATLFNVSSTLSGSQEVPPNGSTATGTASGTYDDVTNMMMLTVTASGFSANVTAAHIHKGAFGVAGGVVFPLSGATGSTSYNSFDMFTYTAAQETDLFGNLHYVNIHSTALPGGEIRGQLRLTAVPEPATMFALAAGIGVLVARRKR